MKILIASSLHKQAINNLSENHDVICAFNAPVSKLKELIVDRDVLIFRSGVQITREVMEASPALKLLIRAGSGLDNLDFEYVQSKGIHLVRIPEPGAKAVAELSFAFMLILSREILKADQLLRKGHWAKSELKGFILNGKVLGIVGTGNIGTRVGEMGASWGMKVIGCVHPSEYSENLKNKLSKKGIILTNFEDVISSADYLSIHTPLNEETRNLINKEVLSKMKEGSYLMNLARGGVVDEQALFDELVSGKRLRGAALDVHIAEGENKISPLASLPNVVLTPHIGAQTLDTQYEIGQRVLQQIDEFEKILSKEKISVESQKA
ncbi:MAG: hypothetical protein Kow0098_16590 [Ignavibacteriaceae bacterium]